jgi:anti-anti-sigma regulatory factor
MTPFSLKSAGSSLRLTLSGEITIEHARALADELKGTLHPGHTLEVDAAQLTRLDAAGLQVLLAAAQTASDATLVAISPAWTDAFARYAIQDPFRIANIHHHFHA